MHKRTLFSILLIIAILFSSNVPTASAWWTAAPNFPPESISATEAVAKNAKEAAERAKDIVMNMSVVGAKIAALYAVQIITRAIIGTGGGGGIVSDWNKYLYISPQQRAMTQMNTFFNTVSRGRLSSLNYEGVGPNYDAYLVAQARFAIAGQPFVTNIQSQATDPKKPFADGNMKGIMSFFQCANNPYCYSLVATQQYNKEFSKAQDIARNEQSNGFLPVRKGGKITQPASIAQNALMQVDQLGTQLIMNSSYGEQGSAAFTQIAAGAGINIASRTLNYATASDEGKAEIRNKNDQFPFSLGYSSAGGFGLNAGGITTSTGIAALKGKGMIGNTCVSAGFAVDSNGNAITDINGKKQTCIPSTTSSVKPIETKITAPSITP